MVRYERLARDPSTLDGLKDRGVVDRLASAVRAHLEGSERLLEGLNLHGTQSRAIQNHVGSVLEDELLFRSEVVLTPDSGFVTRARADFFFALPSGGVIAEVERGGTTANNHDLKDLWKAHLAVDVQHLFLVVPLELTNAQGVVRERPFPKVVRRMSAFFGDPRRFVDVTSVHVFGY